MAPGSDAILAEWRRAVLGLPQNALVHRELRGWRRRALDWRLWVGLRLPRGVREWGLPAVVWFSLAPYVVWATVSLLRRWAPQLPVADNQVIFTAVIFALVLYACLVVAMATATAVTGERQQATWDSLLATPLSGAELTLGALVGRAGPIILGVEAAIGAWAAAQPHYSSLMEQTGGLSVPLSDFVVFGAVMLVRMSTLAALGLAVSARARHGGSATAVSIALATAVLATDLLTLSSLEERGRAELCSAAFLIGSTGVTVTALLLARRWIRRTE